MLEGTESLEYSTQPRDQIYGRNSCKLNDAIRDSYCEKALEPNWYVYNVIQSTLNAQ